MVQEGEEWQLASERAQQQAQQAAAEATRTVAVPKAAAESDTHVTRLPSAMKSASERISLQVRHVFLRTVHAMPVRLASMRFTAILTECAPVGSSTRCNVPSNVLGQSVAPPRRLTRAQTEFFRMLLARCC